MTDRAVITLRTQADRDKAARWIAGIPQYSRVTFQGPKRTGEQNDKLHAMIRDVAQQVTHAGLKLSEGDWKTDPRSPHNSGCGGMNGMQELPDLVLPLKGIYFDQIANGSKREEYRLAKPFWRKRLEGRSYRNVVLTRGYPKAGDADRTMTLPWRGFEVRTITHEHFGPEPVEVFAINVDRLATLRGRGM